MSTRMPMEHREGHRISRRWIVLSAVAVAIVVAVVLIVLYGGGGGGGGGY